MDLRLGHSDIHIPPEILELIVSFIDNDRPSALNARLACRSLHTCVTKRLMVRPSQPSEIFITGTLEVDDDALASVRPAKFSRGAVTVWTWIRLPCKTTRAPRFDEKLISLLWAPSEASSGDRREARGGRVATCWARMKEDPELVAVVMRTFRACSVECNNCLTDTHIEFHDKEALHKYRSSRYARELRDHLDRVASAGVKASTSTRWLLRSPHRNEHQLRGWPLTEIRTVWFKADMTQEQRDLVARSSTNQYLCNITPLPLDCPGPTMFAWLPGLHDHGGQMAVIGRFMLRWRNEEIRRRFVDDGKEGRVRDGEWVPEMVHFERELDAAGRFDQEVHFCDFESGPWRA